jgi:ABC-type transport system substrate-binding protein
MIAFPLFFFLSLSISGREAQDTRPKQGGVFRIKSLSDSFRMQLDPVQPDCYVFLSEQLYDGLVRLDKNLKIQPALADYWMISSDGKKYTFFLKKGVHFHHGIELTAEDVKFSFERLLDEEVGSPFCHFFFTVSLARSNFMRSGHPV